MKAIQIVHHKSKRIYGIMKYKKDEICYIIENNIKIVPVKILKYSSEFYTVKLLSKAGAIRLKEHRIFATEEEARKILGIDRVNIKLLPWDAWRQSFLGTHIYRLQFGDINGNIIQTNQLSIPWLPSEVTVALSKINIPGAGTIAIDYKSAYLTTEGGLYIYCSTAGAAGVASLKWQVVDATIVIQRK